MHSAMIGPDAMKPDQIDYELLRARLEHAVSRLDRRSLGAQRDDVVQASMLRMMRVIEDSDPSTTFSEGYLMRTLYTVTIDEIRATARRSEVPLEGGVASEPLAGPTNPEHDALSHELGEQILRCLRRLVRPRRVAVSLYLLGNSGPETSRALRWNTKRVNNLVYRGLADLRRCLKAEGVTP